MHLTRFKSTFYSSVLYHSRFNPESVAVAFGTQEVTYSEFVRDIERATRTLADRFAQRSGVAMVALSHPYLHWVLTIALGRAGIASVTAYDVANPEVIARIRPDLVLVDAGTSLADGRFAEVSAEWIGREADGLPAFVDTEHAPDTPVRLMLSSGTTGIPKKIMLTHALLQHRLYATSLGASLTGNRSRTMVLVGFDTAGGYQFPMSTWFLGGAVVLRMGNEDPYQTIVRKGVTYAFMAPVQLEHMVRSMPAAAWPVPGLTVSVGGSSLPRRLSEQARARLTPSIVVIYGSTEAGLIAHMHAGMSDALPGVTGVVRPDVDMQIVDEEGQVLPYGEVGQVRSRSLDCVSGYIDSQASSVDSEEIFRDGWFYPGDAGTLSSDGLLSITGRTKELMNLGGVKLSPNLIEETLAACPGVMDIAAFDLDRDGGTPTPWVAVVRGPGYDQAALAAAFQRAFPRLPALGFVNADVIPRNQMGKIQRNVIRERVQRTLPKPA